jgi:L,D-transpeptidase ErfK/SrfK
MSLRVTSWSSRWRIVILGFGMGLAMPGGARAEWNEDDYFAKPAEPAHFEVAAPGGTPADTVIGANKIYRIRKGETMMDIARYFGLGYNEIVEANPGIEPWNPPAGASIILPLQFVLPCCTYTGLVVNIPEMRLYFYEHNAGTLRITTHAVGLGRDDWPTPRASFRVTAKDVNPQWNIPESIRKEHIAERNDPRTFIPGGAPDNPLGKYRLQLSLPAYRIHGTDIPWGVGMQVSHGCVRLYPEDIERLFPMIPIGTPGVFTYQVVKVGSRGEDIFAEVNDDIYGIQPPSYGQAVSVASSRGLDDRLDGRQLEVAITSSGGLAFPITRRAGAPLDADTEWNVVRAKYRE